MGKDVRSVHNTQGSIESLILNWICSKVDFKLFAYRESTIINLKNYYEPNFVTNDFLWASKLKFKISLLNWSSNSTIRKSINEGMQKSELPEFTQQNEDKQTYSKVKIRKINSKYLIFF